MTFHCNSCSKQNKYYGNYNNYFSNLLCVQQIHVNKDQEEKTTQEEKNVENLEMSLVSFTFDCCEWQHQSKYDEDIGI